jgi:hypothetical protein
MSWAHSPPSKGNVKILIGNGCQFFMLAGSTYPPTIHDSFLERSDIVSALERPVIDAAFPYPTVVLEMNLRSMQRLVQFFGWLDDRTDSMYALGKSWKRV